MKEKSNAKSIISPDGLNIYYWMTWNSNMKGNFKVLHPGSSMNHSSLEQLEKGLNERGHPTVLIEPRGVGYSQALAEPERFSLDNYSKDLQKIIETESLEAPSFVTHSFGFMPVVDYVSRTENAENIIGICGSHKFSETSVNKLVFHAFNQFLRYFEYITWTKETIRHKVRGETRTYNDQSLYMGRSEIALGNAIVDVPLNEIHSHIVSGKEINKWNITEQLRSIENPLLLIYADKDLMVKPSSGKYIASLVKGKLDVAIVEGRHSLPITKPKKVLEVIDKYAQ